MRTIEIFFSAINDPIQSIKNFILVHLFYLRMKLSKPMTIL